jgi:Sulfotransferase domain
MQIICDGMQRSGSTWSFNVVKGLLAHCKPGEEIYGGYDENIADFFASVPHTARHVVLKCHLLDPVGKAMARSGQARIIYTWRNLPDALVSFMTMFGGDFEHAFLVLTASLVIYRFHVRGKNALMIGYDELLNQPREAVQRVAAYLGLEPAPAVIDQLVHEQSLEQVRQRVEQFAALPDDAHDPETILHRNHIRDGSTGYGAKLLTKEQLDRLEALRQEYGFF